MTLSECLTHLPHLKRREIECVAKVLFDEMEESLKTKISEKGKRGRIIKLILFGPYAQGGGFEKINFGYRSDYDLLVVVNYESFAEQYEAWQKAGARFLQKLTITRRLSTPVNFIVHAYQDLNDQLAHGRPFFVDIVRNGIMLFELPGYPLSPPRILTPEEACAEAQRHFEHWFPKAASRFELAVEAIRRGFSMEAAFDLHQTTERLYHCLLTVMTLYSPKSHRLHLLRSHAERIAPRLIEVWPRESRFARRCFSRLDRAYVDARYFPAYEITAEELSWLAERVHGLQDRVAEICCEQLAISGVPRPDHETHPGIENVPYLDLTACLKAGVTGAF